MSDQLKTVLDFPKPLRPAIKSDADIDACPLQEKAYLLPVHGIPGLRLRIAPSGRKSFQSSLRIPSGKMKTISLGYYGHLSLQQAQEKHKQVVSDVRGGKTHQYSKHQKSPKANLTATLGKSIVALGYERLERYLARGEITERSAYNDRWAMNLIEGVLGQQTFVDFTSQTAEKLAKKYTDIEWTKADKVKKQIIKIYNGLSSDVRSELRKDIPHMLQESFGRISQVSRAAQFLPSAQLTEVWARMLDAKVSLVMKDCWVFMLLTGERRDACFKIQVNDVDLEKRRIFAVAKGSNGEKTMNLIPLTSMLGALVKRLLVQAEEVKSPYLFPSPKAIKNYTHDKWSGCITSIKPLVEAIGEIDGIRATPHNLRRTLANIGGAILGSKLLADEHILHFRSHMRGSSRHYFDPNALDFLEVRRKTFETCHKHIDDLILSNYLISDFDFDYEQEVILPIIKGILSKRPSLYAYYYRIPGSKINMEMIRNKDFPTETYACFSNEKGERFEDKAQLVSPLGSFCTGNKIWVDLKKRPLFRDHFWNNVINDGEKAPPPDFSSEIE